MRQRPPLRPVRAIARRNDTDQPVTLSPLRLRVKRYGDRHSHEDQQKQTPLHHCSITSSARARSDEGSCRCRARHTSLPRRGGHRRRVVVHDHPIPAFFHEGEAIPRWQRLRLPVLHIRERVVARVDGGVAINTDQLFTEVDLEARQDLREDPFAASGGEGCSVSWVRPRMRMAWPVATSSPSAPSRITRCTSFTALRVAACSAFARFRFATPVRHEQRPGQPDHQCEYPLAHATSPTAPPCPRAPCCRSSRASHAYVPRVTSAGARAMPP